MTSLNPKSTIVSEFADSTPLLADAPALRARAEADGYLFLRGLIPDGALREVRADILGVVARHGWLRPGQNEQGGALDLEQLNQVPPGEMRLDIGVSSGAYDDIQKLESVHRLPHHPAILAVLERLLDGPVLVHPRHIIRAVTGHKDMVPTPPHQDFPLIQGTSATWTCWIPLGDCPRSHGGLTVLRASHKNGYVPIEPAAGAGNIAAQLCPFETDWVSADYRMGDILLFPSYTIHRALPTQYPDDIRLSYDVRYQRADQEVEEKSLLPHCGLSWEEIYAGWSSRQLCYYWRAAELEMSPWNSDLMQPGRRIC